MKIFKILLFVLLVTSIEAKNSKWKPLKPIHEYPASAFNLKKGVTYFEIRQYEVDDNNKLRTKPYKTVLSFQRKPLLSFDKETVRKFHKLSPNLSTKSNISKSSLESDGIGCNYIYNGFTIDDKGKMLYMNMIEDVTSFLGKIDTPAEAQVVLWLHNKHSGKSYSKTYSGYNVIVEYSVTLGECKRYKYRATINKKGKIIKYKLLESRKLKEECLESVSWNPCDDQ